MSRSVSRTPYTLGDALHAHRALVRSTADDTARLLESSGGLTFGQGMVATIVALSLGFLILFAFGRCFCAIPLSTTPPGGFGHTLCLFSIPAAAVGFRSSALVMRLPRSSMLEVLRQDYIRTARAKGASESSVNYRHALKNAILPVITVIGI